VNKAGLVGVGLLFLLPALATAGALQKGVLDAYLSAAKAENASFSGFSAERGKALFTSKHDVSPETPSCMTCHTADPTKAGQTRAGKEIAPMAVSKTPDRFSDAEKVEKWFTRNCQSVIGRACTAQEKGDFITFMTGL
jgi:mono/diheme cytochrome c family protein